MTINNSLFSIDLRSLEKEECCVSVSEAKRLAQDCGLIQYIEISSVEGRGLETLFDFAVSYGINI